MSELPPCDKEVFSKGCVVFICAIPKEEAEARCKRVTAETGHKTDWHYVGGRVVVKTLAPDNIDILGAFNA